MDIFSTLLAVGGVQPAQAVKLDDLHLKRLNPNCKRNR